MRIVSWNCNGAFRKKLHLLEELNADVLVIQECEDPVQCRDAHYKQWATNHLWAGDNKNKGLGVFAKPDVRLEPLNLDLGRLQLFLPLMVGQKRQAPRRSNTSASSTNGFNHTKLIWPHPRPSSSETSTAMPVGMFGIVGGTTRMWLKSLRVWGFIASTILKLGRPKGPKPSQHSSCIGSWRSLITSITYFCPRCLRLAPAYQSVLLSTG